MTRHPKVHITRIDGEFKARIYDCLAGIAFFNKYPPGSRIFVKPNLTFPQYRPGVMTSMEALTATAELLLDQGYKVTIGEAEGGGYNQFSMDAVFEEIGLKKFAARTGISLVNISFTEPEMLTFKKGLRTIQVPVPKQLLHATDVFITMPVPKIHMNTLISVSIKNQWGCIQAPSQRLRLHPFFQEVMFELNKRLPQAHSIVDGSVGLTRSGPMRGDPVNLNWVLASDDLVAADRIVAQLMQIPEQQVRHLQYFRRMGWWPELEDIALNQPLAPFISNRFYLRREWTDWPGYACFNSSFLAWLGYHSPLAGFAHWLLYLFREPFYDHGIERKKLRTPSACNK